jgi:putative hemolysin
MVALAAGHDAAVQIGLPSSRQYQTMAGFLLQQFGKIPDVGEQVEAEDWRFEIVDLDGRRIDKALATRIDAAATPA